MLPLIFFGLASPAVISLLSLTLGKSGKTELPPILLEN